MWDRVTAICRTLSVTTLASTSQKTAARHYHKRFVHGTATAMPFEENTFDAIWTVWVLEHIPNPETALSEMRRGSNQGAFSICSLRGIASPGRPTVMRYVRTRT